MRKLGIFCALAASAMVLAAPASAGDLKGIGSAQCSELTTVWDGANYDGRAQLLTALGQWTFGYLSGRNAEAPVTMRKELASFDSDQTGMYIVTQCKDFPDVYVYNIADIIYDGTPYMTGIS